MRRKAVAFFVLGLAVLTLVGYPDARASSLQIAGQGLAEGVDPATSQPVEPTQSFSANDSAVYSWVELVDVPPPSHALSWIWLTPQRHVYALANATIGNPGQGAEWPSLFYYASINVTGGKAAQIPGDWQVEFVIDGTVALVQNFSISNVEPLVQPSGGWFWPTSTIDVYIQSQPAYARQDALDAMVQWNYSQTWFQQAYYLPARPTFVFAQSDDASSPVTVSFNQTQTGAFTSNDESSIEVNSTGGIESVKCSISVVMQLSTGLETDDVFIENALIDQLGNCLGLGRNHVNGDIMNPAAPTKYDPNSPSTLDLYALYEVSGAGMVSGVNASYSLPSYIPYLASPFYPPQTVSTATAPEFPSGWAAAVTLAVLLVMATTVVQRLRSYGVSARRPTVL